MHWFFFFFLISGFCSLVYQITWLRIAMAAFGVTTPLVSLVLSIFMAGLALGSWGGGVFVSRRTLSPRTLLLLYGGCEAAIGLAGLVVAPLMRGGKQLVLASGMSDWGTMGYYCLAGLLLTAIMLPFCSCMGATFPLAMAAVRGGHEGASGKSFSFLYLANVCGALIGAVGSAFILIELLGFRKTMLVAAGCNLLIAFLAVAISRRNEYAFPPPADRDTRSAVRLPLDLQTLVLLVLTGAVSLAMEVVWTRLYVPFLGPVVYTFATILSIYLVATLLGSKLYRLRSFAGTWRGEKEEWSIFLAAATITAMLPLLITDSRIPLARDLVTGVIRVVFGIGPFCMLLGYLTPAIIDRFSRGNARSAGQAYAANAVGCIAGPLLAGFLLLPWCGERWSLVLLTLPLAGFVCFSLGTIRGRPREGAGFYRYRTIIVGSMVPMIAGALCTRHVEHDYPGGVVLHDHTATVIAAGEGLEKHLLVNGIGMTKLTPITKMMVHLPLASLPGPPRKGLVLCLGMGTSYRSMLSWGIDTTAVELIPSVPRLLPFFQEDGGRLLANPAGRIVVDDARRFLERTRDTFDVIVVDPPPPVEAAASSLLHSREFYAVAARRLAPGGILQQWIPWLADGFEETRLLVSMTMALQESFPHVLAFRSLEGWGIHFLASMSPITVPSPARMAERLPPRAARDLVEWGPEETAQLQFARVTAQEILLRDIIAEAPDAPVLTDDRPLNEYFLLRRSLR